MSVLQERLMLILGDTGRVAVTGKAVLARLQERWPTEHGYASQVVEGALESLRQAGSIHRSVSGRWTRTMSMRADRPLTPALAATPREELENQSEAEIKTTAAGAVGESTQETTEVSKTKVCTGKCGKEKPVDEFYPKTAQCKRCVLDRQKELKAAKANAAKPRSIAKAKATVKKHNGVSAPASTNGAMVAISFALRIEDMNGVFHEISVSKPVVERLVTELREYA
jgi:hypothetical protein